MVLKTITRTFRKYPMRFKSGGLGSPQNESPTVSQEGDQPRAQYELIASQGGVDDRECTSAKPPPRSAASRWRFLSRKITRQNGKSEENGAHERAKQKEDSNAFGVRGQRHRRNSKADNSTGRISSNQEQINIVVHYEPVRDPTQTIGPNPIVAHSPWPGHYLSGRPYQTYDYHQHESSSPAPSRTDRRTKGTQDLNDLHPHNVDPSHSPSTRPFFPKYSFTLLDEELASTVPKSQAADDNFNASNAEAGQDRMLNHHISYISTLRATSQLNMVRDHLEAQKNRGRSSSSLERKSFLNTQGVKSLRFSSVAANERERMGTPEPKVILRDLLSSLKRFDLTTRITYDSRDLKANGGYSDIFIGYFITEVASGATPTKLAVKRIRIHTKGDYDFAKSLAKEIEIWSRLSHPNILPFIGYALEGDDYPCLISEWMENGTARKYLEHRSEYDVLTTTLGIAKGLEYLHGMRVIHSDLKTENVLISPSGKPLICDFGISRALDASATYGRNTQHSGVRGTVRWMAIELVEIREPQPKHTIESDVWAFGMTIYELLARDVPYFSIRNDLQVMQAILSGDLPSLPEVSKAWSSHYWKLWNMCLSCWKKVPGQRHRMDEIVFDLQYIVLCATQDRVRASEDY